MSCQLVWKKEWSSRVFGERGKRADCKLFNKFVMRSWYQKTISSKNKFKNLSFKAKISSMYGSKHIVGNPLCLYLLKWGMLKKILKVRHEKWCWYITIAKILLCIELKNQCLTSIRFCNTMVTKEMINKGYKVFHLQLLYGQYTYFATSNIFTKKQS